jgi:hypothetical protein
MTSDVYSFDLIDNKGKSFEKVEDVFYLPHNSDFKIVFYNKSDKRANVEFLLDGAVIGEFRSNPQSNIKLERPVDKQKAFKFVSANSEEGKQGRLDLAPKLGTIEIRVDPEREEPRRNIVYNLNQQHLGFDETDCVTDCCPCPAVSASSASSALLGGTVLGKPSDQRFTVANHIYTTGRIVVLSAKMMVKLPVESLHM